jgi:hypothetical protein
MIRDCGEEWRTDDLTGGGAQQMKLKDTMWLSEDLVIRLQQLQSLTGDSILLWKTGQMRLEMDALEVRLQPLQEWRGKLLFLPQQVDDGGKHKVNEENSTLYDVLLRLRQVSRGAPSGLCEEKVMNPTIQLAMKLTQIFAPIPFGYAVPLPLVVTAVQNRVLLPLAATELL